MVAEHSEWNRINEHTAGAGVSLAELRDGRFHHPEHSVWTVWWGRDDWAKDLKSRTLSHPLLPFDEQYHLSRFLAYYSPYIHGIDPPINLADFEPKYALHSRCWHYFAPPMLSAATILARQHFDSKRAGLAWLAENNFAAPQVRAVMDQVDHHYDTPERSDHDRLMRFEQLLFTAFEELLEPVRGAIKLLDIPHSASRRALKKHLAENLADPLIELLDNVRYSRIRAGRYFFYLNAPSHFSAERQLMGEQLWTQKLTNAIFASLRTLQGHDDSPAIECILRLGIKPSDRELEALQFMLRLAELRPTDGELRNWYQQALDWYSDFYRLIERAMQQLCAKERARADGMRAATLRRDAESRFTAPVSTRFPVSDRVKP